MPIGLRCLNGSRSAGGCHRLPAGLVNADRDFQAAGCLSCCDGGFMVARPEAMGGGDIVDRDDWCLPGMERRIATIFIAALIGSIIGLFLMIAFGRDRKDALPFGPFLALGAVVSLCWGPEIWVWYGQLGSS